jgi:hypothetical protein
VVRRPGIHATRGRGPVMRRPSRLGCNPISALPMITPSRSPFASSFSPPAAGGRGPGAGAEPPLTSLQVMKGSRDPPYESRRRLVSCLGSRSNSTVPPWKIDRSIKSRYSCFSPFGHREKPVRFLPLNRSKRFWLEQPCEPPECPPTVSWNGAGHPSLISTTDAPG